MREKEKWLNDNYELMRDRYTDEGNKEERRETKRLGQMMKKGAVMTSFISC